ncbi:MAG: ATP-binding cassette domain-containing protein, partial [Desulfomonile sp.]|nr:ATP-binding cassette domain-containing protein [Desulfomonile sp.]
MSGSLPSKDAIRLDGLRVSFGGKLILRDLQLAFPAGRISVVIGRSGSGKTTLLRALNRLNECFPGCETSGTVRIRVGDIFVDVYQNGLPLSELRRRVGMVFQAPNVLPVSIERNLALPLSLVLGIHKKEIPDRVEEALKSAHLWDEVKDRLRDRATTLSGGQQQRLCLARVLALRPDVLLLDEPTASLDYRAAMKIEELLLDLKVKYTIIAVSHSLSQARRLADLVTVLREGQVV